MRIIPLLAIIFQTIYGCPDENWIFSSYNNICYLMPDLKLPWSQAKTYCLNHGGILLSPMDRQQYEFVKGLSYNTFQYYRQIL